MNLTNKCLIIIGILNFFYFQSIYLMKEAEANIDDFVKKISDSSRRINSAAAVAVLAADKSKETLEQSKEALAKSKEAMDLAKKAADSTKFIQKLREQISREVIQLGEKVKDDIKGSTKQTEQDIETLIRIEKAKIEEMERCGVFDKEAQAKARAIIDAEEAKIKIFIKKIIDDPKRISKVVLTIAVTTLVIYSIKHSLSMLVNYLTKPKVITEDSCSWFQWNKNKSDISLSELVFSPLLKKQLLDLALRIKTAKTYKENFPNTLFYGASGTGKTAFVRALANYSGLNYIFTSGSEFAKITDLNIANEELRKLLNFAKNDKKGSIVFIDEAESLFANRKFSGTSKATQDFINTFLSLVPEKSHKNMMFIFATNHPFKLDDAILDRIGPKIEFLLPEKYERQMILALYLQKFAEENKEARVCLHSEIEEQMPVYADVLEGLSPRAIKFVAEEMIVNARRQEYKLLTNYIATAVLNEAVNNLQQEEQWRKEREKLMGF